MLDTLFMQVLDLTKTASVVILAVLVLRLFLKKAPKIYSYALWSLVLFRLLCPVSLESVVSLVPRVEPIVQNYTLAEEPISFAGATEAAYQAVGDALNGGLGVQHIRTTEINLYGNTEYVTSMWWEVWILFGKYVWAAGILCLVIYSMVSYMRLRRQLVGAIPREGQSSGTRYGKINIYLADHIPSPFVMGLVRPKIYLPSSLTEQEQEYILLHEQHHIRRGDHVVKSLAFVALCLHWFNPLVWLAFIFSSKDMEMSCDEAVIKKMGGEIRAEYSASLLNLATGHRIIAGTPLAFGEGDTRGRIKNLSRWRKPVLWIGIPAAVLCLAAGVCLLTNPPAKRAELMGAEYSVEKVLVESLNTPGYWSWVDSAVIPAGDKAEEEKEEEKTADQTIQPQSFVMTEVDEELREWWDSIAEKTRPLQYCITADYHLYYQSRLTEEWGYLGKLEPYEITREELKSYIYQEWETNYRLGEITDCYILRMQNDTFHLVFQTKHGDTLLAYGWEDVSERGQEGSDDTEIRSLYLMKSNFTEGHIKSNFFSRSLRNTVEANVSSFAHFESDKMPGYQIVGFLAGESDRTNEMTDMGYAVFQTTGDGYRLLDCYVYEDAVLAENGIYCCENPLRIYHSGIGGKKEFTEYDVILTANEELDSIEWVYHGEGKEDWVQKDTHLSIHNMSIRSREMKKGYTHYTLSFYDKKGEKLSYTPAKKPAEADVWLDHYHEEGTAWSTGEELTLGEFPGVIFRWNGGSVEAVTKEGNIRLYTGMPIWNVFLTDLTGDGYRELCSTVSFGSGMIDDHVIIYDYANHVSYTLEDRGYHDYSLSMENGQLLITKKKYASEEVVETGYLTYREGCLQVVKVDGSVSNGTGVLSHELDQAISAAVLDHYDDHTLDGLMDVECHTLLDIKESDFVTAIHGNARKKITVYLWVDHRTYSNYNDTLEQRGGSSVPTVLTFETDGSGSFVLKEYWEPRDGSYYSKDIKNKFTVLAWERFTDDAFHNAMLETLEAESMRKAKQRQATERGTKQTIGWILDDILAASPEIEEPKAYLEMNEDFHKRLLEYGEFTLRYCFEAFLKGKETGMRWQVMAYVCQEISASWGEALLIDGPVETGQEWFDTFYANAKSLEKQMKPEKLEKLYPVSWILLEMTQ